MSPSRRKILKVLAFCGGGFVLLLAVLLIAFRIALSYLPDYRAQVQQWVSDRTGMNIQFTHMDARWRYYGPELVFDSAVVRSRDGKRRLVAARQVSVGFDVWTALWTWRLAAGRIALTQPELQIVRTAAGQIEMVGQSELPERDPSVPFRPDELPTGRLEVIDARVSFRDLKSGRGPWIVPGVSFDLKRSGSAMHLQGAAEMPARLGKSLRFSADTAGHLADAPELQWQFQVTARDLDLAGWAEISPKDWPAPQRGQGSFAVAGEFQGASVSNLSAQVQFKNTTLVLPAWSTPVPAPATLEAYVDEDAEPQDAAADASPAAMVAQAMPTRIDYERIVFDLQLTHDDRKTDAASTDRWQLRVKDLELTRPGIPWRRSTVSATVQQSSGALQVSVESELLVLDNLWPLLAYAPESPLLAQVRGLNATGNLAALNAEFARAANQSATYTLRVRMVNLGLSAIGKAPGIANFSGVVEGSETGGRIDLNVRNGTFDLPRFFRTPLPVDRIAGSLQWRTEPTGWRIETNELLLENQDGHARALGEVWVPRDGSSPEVDLHAQGFDLVARAAPRYMPANKLSPKSLEWLDRAFVAGAVPQADFEMRGPVREFPFRKNEGLFLITARVEGVTLDYQPGWMPANDLTADVEFRNIGMTAKLVKGEVNGLQLVSGVGRFADFKQSELVLEAGVKGDLSRALPYIQQSPVGPAIGTHFMALHGSGSMQGQLQLRLPLKNIEQRKLQVRTEISGGTVGHSDIAHTATALRGTLNVKDQALQSLSLQGRFLDGPVTIGGGVEGRYTGSGAGLLLNAEGRAQGPALASLAHLPASIALTGAMEWQLTAHSPRHPPDTPAQLTYRVTSNTKGLGIAMPEPFGKSAESSRELQLEAEATKENILLLRGAFGDARALVRLRKGEQWALDRGGIRADAVAASLPAHSGLRIEGAIPRFVLDDWLKIKGDAPGKLRLPDFLRAANVRVARFGFLGYDLTDVRVVLQAADAAFRADVDGQDIAGQLTIPYDLDSAPLRAELLKLNVPEHRPTNRAGEQNSNRADPRDVPAIVGRVDALSFAGRPVGIARFELSKVPQGVKLVSGELRSEAFTAAAHGSWLQGASGSTSTVVIDVASTDVADTLRAFNYRDLITGERANAHASLTWPGGIDDELLGRASGTVAIEIFDGQLLNVKPGGTGRMLGLLSIGALPRRLSLDFSDVTDKGFSFDKLHADFQINDGEAYTNNLLLSGPQAEVGMVGRVGLGKHDYDQTAVVTGDIGGSLSVASAVVAGPVIGAAVLAFTRLFKEPLKGVTRRYYHITGPWEDPIVERIDKDEAKQGTAEADAAVSETQKENAAEAKQDPSREAIGEP